MEVFERLKEAERLRDQERAAATAFFGETKILRPTRVRASVKRPNCAYCGKSYGNRHTKHEVRRYAIGEKIEPYRGNHHLICEEVMVGAGLGPDNGPGATLRRETWDGISYYSAVDPFCTNTCAIKFAMAAHRAGYRMK
jgi:hypothetical protein